MLLMCVAIKNVAGIPNNYKNISSFKVNIPCDNSIKLHDLHKKHTYYLKEKPLQQKQACASCLLAIPIRLELNALSD